MSLFSKDTEWVTYYSDEKDLHPKIREAFNWYEENVSRWLSNEWTLAGGALRSFFTETSVRDFDLYNRKSQVGPEWNTQLPGFYNWKCTAVTNRSQVFKQGFLDQQNEVHNRMFNFITPGYDTVRDILKTYDFTVCCCAVNSKILVHHPDYFTDLTTRTIRVNNLETPLDMLWRLQKYIKYGFTIDKLELFKIAEAVHEFSNFPELVKESTQRDQEKPTGKQLTIDEIFRTS